MTRRPLVLTLGLVTALCGCTAGGAADPALGRKPALPAAVQDAGPAWESVTTSAVPATSFEPSTTTTQAVPVPVPVPVQGPPPTSTPVPRGTTVPATAEPTVQAPADPPPTTATPSGRVLHVAAGAPGGGDGSPTRPFAEINDGLELAEPGDTVAVAAGTYHVPVVTRRPGTPGAPIRILGPGAPLAGNGEGRLVQISTVT